MAGQIVERVRSWLADIDDQIASLLEGLVTAPCSESERALAQQIDHHLNPASSIGRDLSELVDRAKADDVLGPVLALAAEEAERSRNGSDDRLFPPKAGHGVPYSGSDDALFSATEAPQWQPSKLDDLFAARPENN